MNNQRIMYWVLALVALPLVLLFATAGAHAQKSGDPAGKLFRRISIRPILVDIRFEGNSELDDDFISLYIKSRPTSSSAIKKFFQAYASLFSANPGTPALYSRVFNNIVDSLTDIRYLNMNLIAEDTLAIRELYDDFGYHNASVDYRVTIDTAYNSSRITFLIDEGPRYTLDTITFVGMDAVPPELQQRLFNTGQLKLGEGYSKDKLTSEISRVFTLLSNNGYPYVRLTNPPRVIKRYPPGATHYYDSAIVSIFPDKRYRFGGIRLDSDTSFDTRGVNPTTIGCQVEYQPGEWYNKANIDQTITNLYNLGIFDLIRIDTAGVSANGDSLYTRVVTRLRKLNDFQASFELNASQRVDQYVFNFGTSSSVSFLNLFGGAERLTLGGQLQFRLTDFSEVEWGGNVAYELPNPFCLKRLSVTLPVSYNDAVEDRVDRGAETVTLRSRRFVIAPEVTYRFPAYTLISQVTGRISFQHNSYSGVGEYINAKAEGRITDVIVDGAMCDTDTIQAQVVEALKGNIYRLQVLQGDDPELVDDPAAREIFDQLKQTYILGISAIGDHRIDYLTRQNEYFAPTDGYFLETRADLGVTGGLNGAFARLEGDARVYRPAGRLSSWAFRAHTGTIFRFGRFPLVPLSNRFWAGGSNSIRGWGAREMLVTSPPELSDAICSGPVVNDILRESRRLLGGLFLLEFSGEYRTSLFQLPNNSTLNQQLNQLIGIFFVDMGNAYFRDYDEDRSLITLKNIVYNMGLATGVNFGYKTPVGPIRFGFGIPLYDPVNKDLGKRWVWQRPFTIQNFAWQISIGHAF